MTVHDAVTPGMTPLRPGVVVGSPHPLLSFDPRSQSVPTPLREVEKVARIWPCGAKTRGGGGAPPTTLILLRNQRRAPPASRRRPHATAAPAAKQVKEETKEDEGLFVA